MIAALVVLVALIVAYLVGSIPFGFLVARGFAGVDIRTLGSGNIGATNVGRVLGFRFFWLVFALDYVKGLLPTYYFASLAERISGANLPDLPVGVAVATILGHNFPVYLRFKGGKGVATSLGAVSALDALASVASASGFATFLLITRFVSLSSILGGLVWVAVHFARVDHPWARDQIAMSVATLGLMGLLIHRHRGNLARIVAGTEPKIRIGQRRNEPNRPQGKMMLGLAIGLTVLLAVVGLGVHASRRPEATVGPFRVVEVARVATGHQRAERLAFLDHGRLLAATCPRYGRLMLYRVTDVPGFELVRDIPVGGRPVALAAGEERIYVLSRPNNDARHVEPGWWEAFDFEGRSVSDRVPVGLYPDDLALTKDGRHLLILTSGRGEGGEHRPAPMLAIHQFAGSAHPLLLSQLTFEAKGDDPARLAISSDGSTAAVSLQGSNAVAWVDLSDLAHPQFKDRRAWPEGSPPESLAFDQAGRLVAADPVGEGLVVQRDARSEPAQIPVGAEVGDIVEIPGEPSLWAFTEPMESVVAFLPGNLDHSESPETLALRGRANLASTRPLGLAYCPERGLLAVSNRSGGSLHLVTLRK